MSDSLLFKSPTLVIQNCNITDEGWAMIQSTIIEWREKNPSLEVRIEYCNIGVDLK
jgi:hypothetical protein